MHPFFQFMQDLVTDNEATLDLMKERKKTRKLNLTKLEEESQDNFNTFIFGEVEQRKLN